MKNSRKEEQQQIVQNINNFDSQFEDLNYRFKALEELQNYQGENIKGNTTELHRTNERIIQAKEITNSALNENSDHLDKQIKSIVDDVIILKSTTTIHDK